MIIEHLNISSFKEGLDTSKTVIIPFGSVEEHGIHLPIGTDTIHVYELSMLVSRLYPVFVTPPLWYGLCRSTSQHPGTIGIKGSTLRAITMDVVESCYAQGFRNFVLISGHAGGTHMAFIADAGEELLQRHCDINVAVLTVLDLVAKIADGIVETEGDSHAGEVETSLMLHLRNEYVKEGGEREFPSFPKHILARNKLRYWPGGVWGDPQKASQKKGEIILQREAEALVEIIKSLEQFEQ